MTRHANGGDGLMIAHSFFVSEKPHVIPFPADLQHVAKFELTIGERGSGNWHFTIGDTLEEALPRFAEIVAQQRWYDAHHARSWSE